MTDSTATWRGARPATDLIGTVQEAMRQGDAAKSSGVRRAVNAGDLPPTLRHLSWLFAIYLCFASLRVQEILTVLAVPRLPMLMSLTIAGTIALATPQAVWHLVWNQTKVLRWQVVLVVLSIVTIPTGIWMGRSFERVWPGYFISTMVFIGTVVMLRDRDLLLRVVRILVLTLALITGLVLAGFNVHRVGAEGRLMFGVSLDPNDFAWVLATFVPLAIWLGLRNRKSLPIWFGAAAIFLGGIVATQSRGGFLAVIASAGVLLLFGTSGWRRIALTAALVVAGLGLLAYINASGASRLTDFDSYSGGTGRTELWKQGLKWMVQRPWGFGMGNYETYNVWMTRRYHGAHSAFINVGVELGILGGAAFIAIWATGIRALLRCRRAAVAAASSPGARDEATFLGFFLAAATANIVGSAFLNTQYNAMTLFMQGTLVAVGLGSAFRLAAAGAAPASTTTESSTTRRMRRSAT